MNTETTTDKTGVMMPKAAKASRVHTIWYNSEQKPEAKNPTPIKAKEKSTERGAIAMLVVAFDIINPPLFQFR
jgi:hypothetical protein